MCKGQETSPQRPEEQKINGGGYSRWRRGHTLQGSKYECSIAIRHPPRGETVQVVNNLLPPSRTNLATGPVHEGRSVKGYITVASRPDWILPIWSQ